MSAATALILVGSSGVFYVMVEKVWWLGLIWAVIFLGVGLAGDIMDNG